MLQRTATGFCRKQSRYLPGALPILLAVLTSCNYSRFSPLTPPSAPYLSGAKSFEGAAAVHLSLRSGRTGGSYFPAYEANAAYSPVNHLGVRAGYRRIARFEELSSIGGSGQHQDFNGSDFLVGVGAYKDVTPRLYGAFYGGVGAGTLYRRGAVGPQPGAANFNRDEDFDARYHYGWIEPSLTSSGKRGNRSTIGIRCSIRRFTSLYRPYQGSSENVWEKELPYRLDAFASWTFAFNAHAFWQIRAAAGTGDGVVGARQGSETALTLGLCLGFR